MAGLAVSLIACPCALGLATPLAVWSAIGQAASHQVLFRSGDALERLAGIKAIRFDKTGTLSTGSGLVEEFAVEHSDERTLVRSRAVALSASSPHALSKAISGLARDGELDRAATVDQTRVVSGRGVTGCIVDSETAISLGSPQLMEERGLHLGPTLKTTLDRSLAQGLSVALIGWEHHVRGAFVFREQWRPGLTSMLSELKAGGFDVGVLTGDHHARGRAISGELGVSVEAGLLPEQKVASIERARREIGPVAMVGDGVNDAPALSASDVGIALGCGADVSRDSASVCLLGDDLSRIPWTIALARRTIRVIRQNLFWAFSYNSAGVIMAATGWLNPAVAAFLMVASSAIVIGNSLRLRPPVRDEGQGIQTAGKPIELSASVALRGGPDAEPISTLVTGAYPGPLVLETTTR
jgi:P-type E1-E2 ATPase